MAIERRVSLDELLIRPGTYFNPQTEVMVVVDDSPSIDSEIFNLEEFEGADWISVSDELPVDDARRDQLFEEFQAGFHGGDGRAASEPTVDEEPEMIQDAETAEAIADAEEEAKSLLAEEQQ